MGIFGRIQEIIETQASSGDFSPLTHEELLIECEDQLIKLQNQLQKVSTELVAAQKEVPLFEQQREMYENQLLKWTRKVDEFLNDQTPDASTIKALKNRDYYQWHVNDLTNTLAYTEERIATLKLQITELKEEIDKTEKQRNVFAQQNKNTSK